MCQPRGLCYHFFCSIEACGNGGQGIHQVLELWPGFILGRGEVPQQIFFGQVVFLVGFIRVFNFGAMLENSPRENKSTRVFQAAKY